MGKKMMEDPTFIQKLRKLLEDKNFDEFFDMVQQSLAEDIEYSVADILSNPKMMKMKMSQLNNMIRRFIEREEYEKCAPLRDIAARVIEACKKKPDAKA